MPRHRNGEFEAIGCSIYLGIGAFVGLGIAVDLVPFPLKVLPILGIIGFASIIIWYLRQWWVADSYRKQRVQDRHTVGGPLPTLRRPFVRAPGTFFESGLKYRTVRGELVRSKSEVVIADLLYANGINYRYEEALYAHGGTRYPDFTIYDDPTGTTYYWEHLGMLDNAFYRRRWNQKLSWYVAVGISPIENGGGPRGTLITTRGRTLADVRVETSLAINQLASSREPSSVLTGTGISQPGSRRPSLELGKKRLDVEYAGAECVPKTPTQHGHRSEVKAPARQRPSASSDIASPLIPWIGTTVVDVYDELVKRLDLSSSKGVYVVNVVPGSPASLAGLVGKGKDAQGNLEPGGDVVLALDDFQVSCLNELELLLYGRSVGDWIRMTVHRDGMNRVVTMRLSEKPE